MVGYRRYVGLEAATVLARLYKSVRLYVNHFQPSFKLANKKREGAKVRKRYHPPADTVNLCGCVRDGARVSGRATDDYATAATPLISAHVWKAWVRAARYWSAGRRSRWSRNRLLI